MCRNSSLLWVSPSLCFLGGVYYTRTDGACICDSRWLGSWYYGGRQGERDRPRRQRETRNPVTAGRRPTLTAGFPLLVCLRDVDIFHLRFCTLPLDAGLAFLRERFISRRDDVDGIGGKARNRDQKGAGESPASEKEQGRACWALVFLPAVLSVVSHPSPCLCFVIVWQPIYWGGNLGKMNTCPTIFPPKSSYYGSWNGVLIHICSSSCHSVHFICIFKNPKACTRGKRGTTLKFWLFTILSWKLRNGFWICSVSISCRNARGCFSTILKIVVPWCLGNMEKFWYVQCMKLVW